MMILIILMMVMIFVEVNDDLSKSKDYMKNLLFALSGRFCCAVEKVRFCSKIK